MRANGENPAGLPDQTLWRQSLETDCADDEAQRFLDLAGFADDRLDADDRERVAEWLLQDPAAAADIAAARSFADFAVPPAPEAVVARARLLVPEATQQNRIVAFPVARRERPGLRGVARWGSLAAAVAIAAWLGFTLGINTGQALALNDRPVAAGLLNDLLDTPSNLIADPGEASQT